MQKIFIVEDDENIRELVIYALNSSGFNVFGFEDGKSFKSVLKHSLPDLVILDIMLPGESGIDILKKLRQQSSTKNVPIILLTAKSSEYDKITGLDLGADDYITKPFSVLELISRIKALLRRSEKEDYKNILTHDTIVLDIQKHSVKADDEAVTLTYKEFSLLQYLLLNKGIVLSREKITDKIWGFDFEGESRTVDMHIKTLRQKLGTSGTLIQTIRGVGYKIGE